MRLVGIALLTALPAACAPAGGIVISIERDPGLRFLADRPTWRGPIDQYWLGVHGRLSLPRLWFLKRDQDFVSDIWAGKDGRPKPDDFVIESWREKSSAPVPSMFPGGPWPWNR